MRKLANAITGAITLLVVLFSVSNFPATAYNGIVSIVPSQSPLQAVECAFPNQAAVEDDMCGDDNHSECKQAVANGPSECKCVACGGHANCPLNASIPCGLGLCCRTASGGIKCCR
jgi:hypothetical protein